MNAKMMGRLGAMAVAAMLLLVDGAARAASSTTTPPWNAPASTTIVSEDKLFQSHGASLAGTLYLPAGGHALGAVVVTHGAAIPLRNALLYQHLTEMLPPLGIAVLVYDRRGVGQSQGDPNTGDFNLLADDAIAAVQLLKADPRIDPKRIGVWGLSQGGWLSILAAVRSPDVRFAVSISAPLVPADVQMKFFSRNALLANGYGEADIGKMTAAREAVDAYAHGTGSQQAAQQQLDAVKDAPWFKYVYLPPAVNDRNIQAWRREIGNDPLATLKAVRVPVLVLYGSEDPEVPVAISADLLGPLTAKTPRLSVAVIAGADHGMQTNLAVKDLMNPARAATAKPDSTEYFARLTAWLVGNSVSCQGACPSAGGRAHR